MIVFQRFRIVLALAIAAALTIGGAATKTWAASNNSEKKTAAAKSGEPAAPVDVNSATAAELENVPGIGPTYAKKIIANRPYSSVEELSKTGIPANRLEKLRPLLTVSEKAAKVKPAAGEVRSAGGKTETASKSEKPAALVDINLATAEQLEAIPGLGASYAKKIIAGRPYANVKELSKTRIPASRLEKILPLVTVTQATAVADSAAEKSAAKPTETAKPAGASSTATSKPGKTDKPATKTLTEARTPPQKGMVWANTDTKVYHVEGDHWYGRTKKGEWMTAEDAVKAGYRKAK